MNRTVPDRAAAAAARFNQQIVTRFENPINKALGHGNTRNSLVVQTLSYFSLMRNTGSHSLTHSVVAIEKAVRRLLTSHDGNQAAHYLPGQIHINGTLPWGLIGDRPTGLRLECLFAAEEDLPPDFNKADSAAEKTGLCEAFRVASLGVLHDPGPRTPHHASRNLIRRIYDDIWIPQSLNAFSVASAQKEARGGIPEPQYDEYRNIINIEEISAAGEGWRFDEQHRILERYSEAMRTPPPDLGDEKIGQIEREFLP
jgi:hypothetical protein